MIDLDDKLVQDGLIDANQLDLVRLEAVKTDKSVWYVLVKMGYLAEEQVMAFFGRYCGVAYVNLADYRLKESVVKLIDEHFCRQNGLIPLFKVKDVLYIACSNPLDSALLDATGKMSGCLVEPLMASYPSIQMALDHFWKLDDRHFEVANFIASSGPMKGLSYWRQAERLPLSVPVRIELFDASLSLSAQGEVRGQSRDLSADGQAAGFYAPVYLPRGATIFVTIEGKVVLRLQAEVVHCQMIEAGRYFLGVRFSGVDVRQKDQLIKLVTT